MIVMKFGGTSVGTAERIRTVAGIVGAQAHRKPVVVVSALGGVTDSLIRAARDAMSNGFTPHSIAQRHAEVMEELGIAPTLLQGECEELDTLLQGVSLLRELTPRTRDLIMSFGERMAAKTVAAHLTAAGLRATAYNAYDVGFVTDSHFGDAGLLPETEQGIQNAFRSLENAVPVITGFIAKNAQGEITTLGRGGSDYTASVLGAALDAEEVQIWTDVDGIMTADPKIVKDAKTVATVTYEEASELAMLGAKVLHPKTILPAVRKSIPVRILNTYNPRHAGTTVLKDAPKESHVAAIACRKGVQVVDIHAPEMFLAHGFLHKVFKIFDEQRISVDFVSTSEVSVSITIDGGYDTAGLQEELGKLASVEIRNCRATVSVVGRPPGTAPVIPGKVYTLFEDKKIDIEMISAGVSKINETVVVKEEDADDAVRIMHAIFFGD